MCVCVCVTVSVCSSGRYGYPMSGTMYLQKELDMGNKKNRILAENVSS